MRHLEFFSSRCLMFTKIPSEIYSSSRDYYILLLRYTIKLHQFSMNRGKLTKGSSWLDASIWFNLVPARKPGMNPNRLVRDERQVLIEII